MDTQEILAVHDILHLVYHRNKNQHRQAKWWKWLSQLKRTARDLASRDTGIAIPVSHKEYLSTHLIPRCYLAFSTVVAENQFMALGIVLMATLSRFSRAAGIKLKEKEEKRPKPQVKKTLLVPSTPTEDRGERVSRTDISGPVSSQSEPEPRVVKSSKKSEKLGMEVDVPTPPAAATAAATATAPPPKKAKKSKKKKNAIDDLFSGLL